MLLNKGGQPLLWMQKTSKIHKNYDYVTELVFLPTFFHHPSGVKGTTLQWYIARRCAY